MYGKCCESLEAPSLRVLPARWLLAYWKGLCKGLLVFCTQGVNNIIWFFFLKCSPRGLLNCTTCASWPDRITWQGSFKAWSPEPRDQLSVAPVAYFDPVDILNRTMYCLVPSLRCSISAHLRWRGISFRPQALCRLTRLFSTSDPEDNDDVADAVRTSDYILILAPRMHGTFMCRRSKLRSMLCRNMGVRL